jgi:hypothetical protein
MSELCERCGRPIAWHRLGHDLADALATTVVMVRLDDGTLLICDVQQENFRGTNRGTADLEVS